MYVHCSRNNSRAWLAISCRHQLLIFFIHFTIMMTQNVLPLQACVSGEFTGSREGLHNLFSLPSMGDPYNSGHHISNHSSTSSDEKLMSITMPNSDPSAESGYPCLHRWHHSHNDLLQFSFMSTVRFSLCTEPDILFTTGVMDSMHFWSSSTSCLSACCSPTRSTASQYQQTPPLSPLAWAPSYKLSIWCIYVCFSVVDSVMTISDRYIPQFWCLWHNNLCYLLSWPRSRCSQPCTI